MKYLILVLLLPIVAQAEWLAGASSALLLEEEVDGQSYDLEYRPDFYIGYKLKKEEFIFSYKNLNTSTNNGLSSIEDKNKEVSFYYLREVFPSPNSAWKTMALFGFGLNWSDIYTRFAADTVVSTSDKDLVLDLGFEVNRHVYKKLWYAFDAKAIFSEAYTTNPTIEFSLLKLYFVW